MRGWSAVCALGTIENASFQTVELS